MELFSPPSSRPPGRTQKSPTLGEETKRTIYFQSAGCYPPPLFFLLLPPAGYGGTGKGAVSKFLLKDLPRFQVDQKPNRGNKITHQCSMKFVNELHVVAQCTTCRSDVSIASNIFWRTRKTRRQKRVPCCPPPRLNLAQIWGFLLARRS